MNAGYLKFFLSLSRIQVSLQTCAGVSCISLFKRTMSAVPKDFGEDLLKNPYYEKYSKKIQDLQKTSPEDFKSRVEECKKRREQSKFERDFSSASQPKESLSSIGNEIRKSKALNDVMKMDLIQDMTAEEISELWETHFKDKDVISATIPVVTYNLMYERGRKFPIFVLPLPRDQGYEFFVCQVDGHEVHFTSLINYQAHKENAPECLTIVHYTDLGSKGIVLMHGVFNSDVLNAFEAQCLANQFQLYYGKTNDKRLNLLERLNHNPNDFKHMDLIAELECLSFDSSGTSTTAV